MPTDEELIQDWLLTKSPSTRKNYPNRLKEFSEFYQKSPSQMLLEKPQDIARKIAEYQALLFSGKVQAKLAGAKAKGVHGGCTGRFKEKAIAPNTARMKINTIKSFFAFHDVLLNTKKYRMPKTPVEKRKYFLQPEDISKLMSISQIRDKAILALGFMGIAEDDLVELKWEQFTDKLGESQIEFVDSIRGKTKEEFPLMLTREVQSILVAYNKAISPRKKDYLLKGYKNRHLAATECNGIFKGLCQKIGLVENGKRLSFHCLRMWFSSVLKGALSDNTINLLMGHHVAYGGAYDAAIDNPNELRRQLEKAHAEELLRLQPIENKELTAEFSEQKKVIEQQEEMIKALQAQLSQLTERQTKTEHVIQKRLHIVDYEPKKK